jgi:uncharacterized protein YjdB
MQSTMKFLFTSLALFLMAIDVCAQQTTSNAVKTVVVTAAVKETEVGQPVQLSVVAKDAAGNVVNEKPSVYFAGPFDIAAADENGVVKVFGEGEVTAGAIVGGKSGFTSFVVKPASIKSIEITPVTSSLPVGSSTQLSAAARIFTGDPRSNASITWSSDNARIATVDAGGLVTAVAPGTASITATSGTGKAMTRISVIKNTLRSLTVSADASTARTGDVVHFKAIGDPTSDFTPRWSVSGNGATVYMDGGFVADQPGNYVVTA